MVDKNIERLEERFHAIKSEKYYRAFQRSQQKVAQLETKKARQLLGLGNRANPNNIFKIPGEDNRLFVNYWAPIITMENEKRIIRPMRYRIRPSNGPKEIPSKYNVFNARIDALEKRRTWKNIFMKKHGLFPFLSFFEWVEDKNGKSRQIQFLPESYDLMWAPCLWDEWVSEDKEIVITSFALITDDPPPEVAEKGHDRCPIFLNENLIDLWLTPEKRSKEEIYGYLKELQKVYFASAWAA